MKALIRVCKVCSKYYNSSVYFHKSACGPRCLVVYNEKKEAEETKLKEQKQLELQKESEKGRKRKAEKKKRKRLENKLKFHPGVKRELERKNYEIARLKKELEAATTKTKNPYVSFYDSREWRELRFDFLKTVKRMCVLCKRTDGQMHVDHIIPRSIDRSKELDFNNLQILCADCNIGKGNRDTTDFRRF